MSLLLANFEQYTSTRKCHIFHFFIMKKILNIKILQFNYFVPKPIKYVSVDYLHNLIIIVLMIQKKNSFTRTNVETHMINHREFRASKNT